MSDQPKPHEMYLVAAILIFTLIGLMLVLLGTGVIK
jgi:hypothetical protein